MWVIFRPVVLVDKPMKVVVPFPAAGATGKHPKGGPHVQFVTANGHKD